jgi:hypothetical protein
MGSSGALRSHDRSVEWMPGWNLVGVFEKEQDGEREIQFVPRKSFSDPVVGYTQFLSERPRRAQAGASSFNEPYLKAGLTCFPQASTDGWFPPYAILTLQVLPVDRFSTERVLVKYPFNSSMLVHSVCLISQDLNGGVLRRNLDDQ